MVLELTQEFYFEAAHTLVREHATESSRRVHGHTYHAEVTVRGEIQAASGMILDLAVLKSHVETVRQLLDHQLLDDVPGLGPPTLENLVVFIAGRLRALDLRVSAVRVGRKASGDSCLGRF
ncbi:MAG: 6-carboxytetrahydropterin synthase [Gammaproteobacteria bacterium]